MKNIGGEKAEELIGKKLKKEFHKSFSKKNLIVRGISKEFDLVSDDNKIVVEVKSYKLGNVSTKKAGYTTTRKWRLIGACVYLEKVKAKERILALTNKELHEQFMKDAQALFPTVAIRYFKIS